MAKVRKAKKPRSYKPNLGQKPAIDKVVESGGKKAVSVAMIEAGFSPQTARNPSKLTKSRAWQELMEKHFADERLFKRYTELLDKREYDTVVVGRGKKRVTKLIDQPDTQAVSKALDMAYKLKGKYPKDEDPIDPRSLILTIFSFIQNGTVPIVAERPQGTSRAEGSNRENVQPTLEAGKSVLDQRQTG